jgi:hypothetical protein
LPRKLKSIEFLFLALIGLTLLVLVSLLAIVIFDSYRFSEANPENSIGAEWASMAFIVLLLGIAYAAIFFVWEYRLWRNYTKTGVRKAIQLILIFVIGIFPFLNLLLDLVLRHVMNIEKPLTEEITKAFLYILLFPITGGK